MLTLVVHEHQSLGLAGLLGSLSHDNFGVTVLSAISTTKVGAS